MIFYKKKHLLITIVLLLFCLFLTATATTSKKKIVLAGSSSIFYWSNAKSDLSPHKVINKGIRASTADSWNKAYYKQIINQKPDIVILYVGGNDLSNPSISVETVAKRIQKLIMKIHNKLPKAKIYYVSINPSILNWKQWNRREGCNKLMRKFCIDTKRVIYINTAKYCLKNGVPNTSLYRSDKLHLNSKGYKKIWKNIVAKKIKNDLK